MMPAFASSRPRCEISIGESPGGISGGPGSVSCASPAERSLVCHRGQPFDADLVVAGAEAP